MITTFSSRMMALACLQMRATRPALRDSIIPFVGFGDGFLDYDNDGWKDLLIVNGHVYPEVDRHPEWGQVMLSVRCSITT